MSCHAHVTQKNVPAQLTVTVQTECQTKCQTSGEGNTELRVKTLKTNYRWATQFTLSEVKMRETTNKR